MFFRNLPSIGVPFGRAPAGRGAACRTKGGGSAYSALAVPFPTCLNHVRGMAVAALLPASRQDAALCRAATTVVRQEPAAAKSQSVPPPPRGALA